MSTSPPVIFMSDKEDAWIAEHKAVIEKVKRAKEEHQRQGEEDAWRQAEAEAKEAHRKSEAKEAHRKLEAKEAWRHTEESERAWKEAEKV